MGLLAIAKCDSVLYRFFLYSQNLGASFDYYITLINVVAIIIIIGLCKICKVTIETFPASLCKLECLVI